MPTYRYLCETGHEFEVFQKITEEPVQTCSVAVRSKPDVRCGSPCHRVIQAPAFHLKGKGWYRDGYSK